MKKKNYDLIVNLKHKLLALVLTFIFSAASSQTTFTYNFTGGVQTMNLQAGSYSVEVWGADGGATTGTNVNAAVAKLGGKGGYARGILTLAAPTTASIYVGGKGNLEGVNVPGGFNGGGNSGGGTSVSGVCGSGGGASDIRIGGSSFANRQIVAGGGGAAGFQECNGAVNAISGGHGGGLTGGTPVAGSYATRIGQGGTQTAGGAGGADATYVSGNPGSFGLGGNGGTVNSTSGNGAGGGGGWYGGGSGANGFYCAGGGGGGSSYIGGVTSATTIMFGQAGFVNNPDLLGNGLVIITEICSISMYAAGNTNSLNPMICAGQSATLMTNAISNYSWSTGATSSSIIVSPTSNTVYALTALSPSNCTSSRTITILVSSGLPVLSISNPSNNICFGKTVSLTATGALTYTWANVGVVNGQTFTPSSTAVYTVTGQNGCGTSSAVTTITIAPLSVSASASPTLVCQGYTTALSGIAAATAYTWMPGTITGSAIIVAPSVNTVYTLTASDGTCAGTQTVLVATKTTPSIVTSQTLSNICMGQSINLSASGAGTGGTYSWSTGGTGTSIVLAPSTSTSVVVAGTNSLNCTSTAQQIIIVNQPPALAVTANKFAVCTGDPVILTASGAPIYQWINGPATANFTVNPAVTTVYTITGSQTTNTCTIDATITINAIVPNVSVTSSVAVCAGGSVAILANGASLYKWNGGLNSTNGNYVTTPAVSSVFTLVATTSSFNVNCLTTHYASVTVNQNPTITVTPGKETICRGETHTLTANGASTYSWTGSTGTGSVITVKPTSSTFYTVTGVDANGCESSILYNAKVNSCNGIDETSKQQLISVYPNPNNGQFFINAENTLNLNLINTLGQLIQSIELNTENGFSAEVKGLAKGVYYLSSVSAGATSTPTKLIVN